jgi:hypothetical protein
MAKTGLIMATFNVTTGQIIAGQAKIPEVEKACNKQLKETGEAQSATEARDTSFEKPDVWLSDFVAVVINLATN